MECREIRPNDWKQYKEFRLAALKSPDARAFGGSYEKEVVKTEEEWRSLFNGSKPRFFYGCFDGEKIVSVAGAYFNQDNEEFIKEWILVGVYTNPEYRGKGLSSKIISVILTELISKGVKKVVLYVNTKQGQAIKLYEKLGFKAIKIIKDQVLGDGNVYDELVMEITLV